MREVEQIYLNEFGISFHWKRDGIVLKDRVQVVFKETGFYFSKKELEDFASIIDDTQAGLCSNCCHRQACHKFLLKTPLQQIDLAVSRQELLEIKDLIRGTLFTIELYDYINKVCRN